MISKEKRNELRKNIQTLLVCPNCCNILTSDTKGVYKCFNCNFLVKKIFQYQIIQSEEFSGEGIS